MEAQETNQDSTSKSLCFGSGFELWNSDTALGRALREQFPGAVTSLTLLISVNEPPTITVTYDNLDVMLCDDVPDIIKTFVPKEQPPELDNKEETE